MCWRNAAHSASGATIGPPIQNRVAILPSSPAFWWGAVHCGICILGNVRIIVHNKLCCCHKYRVLSNLILFNLLPSAFVDDLVMIYLFSFDLYTTWLDVDP